MSSLWAIYSNGRMQHVMVMVGECYLDGDGASTEGQLLRRWEKDEFVENPELGPFVAEKTGEIECPAAVVREVVSSLNEIFGPGERVIGWARKS